MWLVVITKFDVNKVLPITVESHHYDERSHY